MDTLADLPKTPTRCLPQEARSSATDAWTLVHFIRTRDSWDSLRPEGMNHSLYLVGCLVLFQTICPHDFPPNTANRHMLHKRRCFLCPSLSHRHQASAPLHARRSISCVPCTLHELVVQFVCVPCEIEPVGRPSSSKRINRV